MTFSFMMYVITSDRRNTGLLQTKANIQTHVPEYAKCRSKKKETVTFNANIFIFHTSNPRISEGFVYTFDKLLDLEVDENHQLLTPYQLEALFFPRFLR